MCGIFGYVGGRSDAAKVVFEGLKRLEYRGYDSWGIAAINQRSKIKGQKLIVEKHVGKIGDSQLSMVNRQSTIALGHTRWATHGGVTVANAHPHIDCSGQIALVHNGIVENFQNLKKALLLKHQFKSQTDTEVVLHKVEEKTKKMSFFEATRKTFMQVAGLNAFVFVNSDGQMVAAKSGTPLVIGLGKNETFIASDAAAILPHTKKMIFVEDGQIIKIRHRGVEIYEAKSGKRIKEKITDISWQVEDVSLGKYKHFMLKEIYEQPRVLKNLAAKTNDAQKLAKLVESCHGTFFVACGSASHAALCGTYLFSRLAKKHVNFSIGSEFNYLEDFINSESLIVPISQSGESVDVIEPVVRARKKGAKIAAIVNVYGSTLWREADFNFLIDVGVERAVVATKSLTAMMASLILVSYALVSRSSEGQKLIIGAADDVSSLLKNSQITKIKKVARFLMGKEHVYIIGRGISYPVALEAALKLKESCYIHAEGFAAGELKHGVIALIEKGTPCIVFAPNDETFLEIASNAQEIRARGGYIIGVGPRNNEVFDEFLQVEDLAEATMISQIVISQLLAYFIAIEKGLDPDKPRNLAKSVTVK